MKKCNNCGKTDADIKFTYSSRECNKCRYERNKVRISAYYKSRRASRTDERRLTESLKHNDRIKKMRSENPHLTFLTTSRYHAKKLGVISDLTEEQALDLFQTPEVCSYCEKAIDDKKKRSAHFDHIIPMSQGGPNSRWNITKVCISCNASKGSDSLIGFYERSERFTQQRYEEILFVMSQISGRGSAEIEMLLEKSAYFEKILAQEIQKLRNMLIESLRIGINEGTTSHNMYFVQ